MTERDFAAEGRRRKAAAIASALRARGYTADQAAALDAAGRRATETLARIKRKGSDETWAAVVEILRGGETQTPDRDPFEGLPGA